MCGFLCIIMHPEGGLGFMDKPCDRRTSDGVTNHRIWQEFHTVLWDSARFYAILRIMVCYGYGWISKQVSTRFRLVPSYSFGFYFILRTLFCISFVSAGFYGILLYSFRSRAMLCYSFVQRISCHEFCL